MRAPHHVLCCTVWQTTTATTASEPRYSSHLDWFPPQYEKGLGSLLQEACELVHQDVLNLVCLLDLDADAHGVDGWLDQDALVLVTRNSQRRQKDFGRSACLDFGDIVALCGLGSEVGQAEGSGQTAANSLEVRSEGLRLGRKGRISQDLRLIACDQRTILERLRAQSSVLKMYHQGSCSRRSWLMSCTVQGETSGAAGLGVGRSLGGDRYVPPWLPRQKELHKLAGGTLGEVVVHPCSRLPPNAPPLRWRRAACSGRHCLPFALLHASGVFCGDELSQTSSHSFFQDDSVVSFPSPSIHLRHGFPKNHDKENQQDGCQQYVIPLAYAISRSRMQ